MKTFIKYLSSLLLVTVIGCSENPDIWESEAFELSGDWLVQYDHPVYGADPWGNGLTHLTTFNTADNDPDSLWLTDGGAFWDFKVKISGTPGNLTFGSQDTVIDTQYGVKTLIRNGKIMEGVSEMPSGYMADSIYFEVWWEDLEGATGIASDTLFVSGYRHTGLPEDPQ